MSFWSQFEQASCTPECMCEYPQDALIRQPSAFWSSLGYIAAALILYRQVQVKTHQLRLWVFAGILMGLSSMFAHMSFIKLGLAIDFASIILILSFFVVTRYLKDYWQILLYHIVLTAIMYFLDKWTKIGLCLVIFILSLMEIGLHSLKSKSLQLAVGILGISFGFFLMDEFHYGCDPHSLLQWHSVWHLGTALAMYFYGRYRFIGAA